jgi:hypothetical protein
MSPEIFRSLAKEIVIQTISEHWLYYAIIAGLTIFFSTVGSFLSSYFSRRAEHRALEDDFDDVKRQLRDTTAISESIKVDIKQLSDRSEKLQWLKREKLEDYVVAVLRGIEYLTLVMRHYFFDADLPKNEDPLLVAAMLQKLYLPELDEEHSMLMKAVAEYRSWISLGMQERLEIWKATNVKSAPSQETCEQYTTHLKNINGSVILVEQAAKKLAREMNHV